MRLLLDTHALLWWLADDPTLDASARDAITSSETEVFVSAAVMWEIEIKRASGRLRAPSDLLETIEGGGFRELPVSGVHAVAAAGLPPHHADPFDRMLVAQAQLEGLTLVTRDERLRQYDVPTFPA